jgi:TPR repeat protein
MYNLGSCYFNGKGVRKNEVEAIKWCRKAAELGHEMAKQTLTQLSAE